jgi:penicillin-insensitive murein endopeptidase
LTGSRRFLAQYGPTDSGRVADVPEAQAGRQRMRNTRHRPESCRLIALLLVLAVAAQAAAADDAPRTERSGTVPLLEEFVFGEPVGDATTLRVTAERDPRALGPLSIGTPDAGLLLNPMLFPAGPFWTLREPEEAWATDETVDFIVNAIEAVEARYPGSPRLVIGDLSHPKGGRIDRHRSHQVGRDADLGFYYHQGEAHTFRAARPSDLDAPRSWAFVRALVTETDVDRIFIDRSLIRVLYDQAVAEGEDRAWLADIFGRTSDKGIIQHERRHKDHLHVRFYNRRAQEHGRIVYPVLVESGMAPPPNVRHRVRSGETLGSIARRYGTSVTAIRNANGLRSTRVRAGRSYTIPVRKAPVDSGPVVVPPRRLPPQLSARVLSTD